MPGPSEGQILIKVRVSGVGPTDLKVRSGDLNGVFPLPEPAVLGFETAGVVDAIGSEVTAVTVGDEVAALRNRPRSAATTWRRCATAGSPRCTRS
jgi:NADPH:quinone reductase-like Zn-dependent oxidoreductase